MQSLTRLRSERYSSSSGHRLSGPLLQSYHGSPRHSFRVAKKSPSPAAVLFRAVVLVLALAGCWVGGKHLLHNWSAVDRDSTFLASIGLGPAQEGSSPARFWATSDLSLKLPRPPVLPWGKKDYVEDPDPARFVKASRANR